MTNKERYISFVEQNPNIPLFYQPWWLDAVTIPDKKEWDVILAQNKNGEIEGVMPFVTGTKFGQRFALTPQLTQYTGIWIPDKTGESVTDRLSREKKIQTAIIRQLEDLHLHYFDLAFHPSFTYWSPFYWAGYKQTTHYSYRIEDLTDIDKVYQQLDNVKKRHIRNAEKQLEVRFDMSTQAFLQLQCLQFGSSRQDNIYSGPLITYLIDEARRREHGFIVSAGEPGGDVHAAFFIPYDKDVAYELISAIHPQHRTSGGSVLALWSAIKKASEVTKVFDFEGSMLENVDHNNRQFGGTPTPYFHITRKSKWIEILELCKK